MAVAVHAIVARGMLHFAFYVRVLTCRSCRVFSSQVFVLISMGVDVCTAFVRHVMREYGRPSSSSAARTIISQTIPPRMGEKRSYQVSLCRVLSGVCCDTVSLHSRHSGSRV